MPPRQRPLAVDCAMPLADLSPLRVEIDLDAIAHNARVLADLAGPAAVLGVVKADAYGHGAVPVTQTLLREGIERFAVATVGEAAELREAGIDASILVFAAPLAEALPHYARLGLGVTVSSPEVAALVAEAASQHGPLTAHVKVDTGMHRLGLTPEAVSPVLRMLADAPGVTVEALWTHLATADGDLGYAHRQLDAFDALLEHLGPLAPGLTHVANGPLLLRETPRAARPGTLVRAGGVLYGMASSRPLAPEVDRVGLRPAMRLSTRVVHLQTLEPGDSVSYGRTWTAPEARIIATLAAGYADGIPRGLSNAGHVGIGGRLAPIAGRVCMDMLMVDLGTPEAAGDIELGDEAILFGPGGPSVLDQAEAADTIPYDLTCALAPRVARTFRGASVAQNSRP